MWIEYSGKKGGEWQEERVAKKAEAILCRSSWECSLPSPFSCYSNPIHALRATYCRKPSLPALTQKPCHSKLPGVNLRIWTTHVSGWMPKACLLSKIQAPWGQGPDINSYTSPDASCALINIYTLIDILINIQLRPVAPRSSYTSKWTRLGLPGSPEANLLANAEDTVSIPHLGRSYVPRTAKPVCHSYWAHAPWILHSAAKEATAVRSQSTTMMSMPHSLPIRESPHAATKTQGSQK